MKIRKLIYTAVFIAIGVLLPQVFHLTVGKEGGAIFLPMHIPALSAGLILGPLSGIITGVISPFLSSLITGMPAFDKMPFMMLELGLYGGVSGLIYKKLKINMYISLLLAMIIGRIGNMLMYFILGNILNMQGYTYMMAITSTVKGLPGIAIQLIMIPLIVIACRKVVKDIV